MGFLSELLVGADARVAKSVAFTISPPARSDPLRLSVPYKRPREDTAAYGQTVLEAAMAREIIGRAWWLPQCKVARHQDHYVAFLSSSQHCME
jgi:hypothetical protein